MPRILIVEDNESNRDMLSRRLARRGYETAIAIDGKAGLESAVNEEPDLILMDMSLPEIDGWEVTRRLKADERTRGTPVLALTAHAMAGDREKAMSAGCDDYETKPVEFVRLLGKIETLLKLGCRHDTCPPGEAGDKALAESADFNGPATERKH